MSETFTCAVCGLTFSKNNSDESAMAECRSYFGNIDPSECCLVCDRCFQRIHPDDHPYEVENAVAQTIREREPSDLGRYLGLHQHVDVIYVVDGYLATFYDDDGDTFVVNAQAETIVGAIEALGVAVRDSGWTRR